MPQSRSAEKRVRQNVRRRTRNRAIKSALTTRRRRFGEAVADGDVGKAEAALKAAQKAFDQAGAKGTVHKNAAARKISRMARKLAALKTPEA